MGSGDKCPVLIQYTPISRHRNKIMIERLQITAIHAFLFSLATVALLASCARRQPAPDTATPPPAVAAPMPSTDSHAQFRVIESESFLRVKVMRGGPLSRFGHNHVVGGPVFSGQAGLADRLTDSQLELSIRLVDFQVDEPQWRLEAGEAFASVPSEEDIAATRLNMMGPGVLDTQTFPVATVGLAGILGTAPDFSVLARITLKGRTRSLPVPVHFERAGQRITASGSFILTQSDFGIEPFSVLLGAIRVQDDLEVRYKIVASAVP